MDLISRDINNAANELRNVLQKNISQLKGDICFVIMCRHRRKLDYLEEITRYYHAWKAFAPSNPAECINCFIRLDQ